jgi:hypothetical protein
VRRAGQQLLESSFLVLALILILEWIVPVLGHRPLDGDQFVFACIFGVLLILLQTATAYLRPATRTETVALVEEILYEEEQRRTAPGMPKMVLPVTGQFRCPPTTPEQTWMTTMPNLPAVGQRSARR